MYVQCLTSAVLGSMPARKSRAGRKRGRTRSAYTRGKRRDGSDTPSTDPLNCVTFRSGAIVFSVCVVSYAFSKSFSR